MYKEILLPIDLNHESSWRKALPCALELAKAFGARLHIMTVVPDFGMSIVANYFPKDYEKKALEAATAALHDFTKKHLPKHWQPPWALTASLPMSCLNRRPT